MTVMLFVFEAEWNTHGICFIDSKNSSATYSIKYYVKKKKTK